MLKIRPPALAPLWVGSIWIKILPLVPMNSILAFFLAWGFRSITFMKPLQAWRIPQMTLFSQRCVNTQGLLLTSICLQCHQRLRTAIRWPCAMNKAMFSNAMFFVMNIILTYKACWVDCKTDCLWTMEHTSKSLLQSVQLFAHHGLHQAHTMRQSIILSEAFFSVSWRALSAHLMRNMWNMSALSEYHLLCSLWASPHCATL